METYKKSFNALDEPVGTSIKQKLADGEVGVKNENCEHLLQHQNTSKLREKWAFYLIQIITLITLTLIQIITIKYVLVVPSFTFDHDKK